MTTSFQHTKIKNWLTVLISLALAAVLILSQITYAPELGKWLYTLDATGMTRKWLAGTLAQYALRILAASAILWALSGLLKDRITLAGAGHFWLLAFWGGWGLAFTLLLLGFPFWPKNAYDATFLLTRNAFPFITGLFTFTLVQPWLRRIANDRRTSLVLLGLLVINIIWPSDLLQTGAGTTFTAALLFATTASIMVARPRWLTTRWWLTLPVGLVSIFFMGWYQASRQASMSASSRFVLALSPLTLIPAILIVQWLHRLTTPKTDQRWQHVGYLTILLAGLLATGTSYNELWLRSASFCQRFFRFLGPLWVAASALALTIYAAVLTTVLVLLVPRLRIWHRLTNHWSVDLSAGLQQLVDQPRLILGRIWHNYHRPAIAFITFYLIQCLSSLMMNQSWHMTELMTHAKDNIVSSTILHGSAKMLCGTLIMLAGYWVVLALFNRYWLALISVATISLGFGVASRLKLLSRSEPIVPADLSELHEFKSLMGMVSPWIIAAITVLLVVAIGAIVWLEHRYPNAHQSWPSRLAKLLISLWFIIGLGGLNHYGKVQNRILKTLGVWTESNLDELLYAQQNGPVMSFISLLDVHVMDRPQGYSKQAIQTIITRYEKEATKINRTRHVDARKLTVMFNLSESFSNPSAIAGVRLNKNPIPYISKLKTQTTSGRMLAASFGGGTANMEYMSLTGLSMGLFASAAVVPNNMVVPNQSVSPNIGNLFTYPDLNLKCNT